MLGSFIDALLENKVVFVEFIPHAYTLSQQTIVWLARNVSKNVITKYALKSSVTKSVSVMHSRAVELYQSILTDVSVWNDVLKWADVYIMMSHICERRMLLIALFYIKMRRIAVGDAGHQETTTPPLWSNQFMVSGQSNSSKHNFRIYNQRRIDCHFDSVDIEFIYANK